MYPFARNRSDSVASLGEVELITRIRRWLGDTCPPSPEGIGDDCAVLPGARAKQVITVDPVVYGRHFDDSVSPRDVGAKLLKRNLSDIAAMGAKPTAAVLALTLDGNVSAHWLEQFYRGIAATARRFDVAIVGGDIAQAERALIASLTLLGEAAAPRVLTREGAEIGDAIYVTGKLGGSLLGHHYRFTPRLKEGAWLAGRSEVRSMMDLSDGLAKDLHALAPKKAIAALLPHAIPISAAARTRAKTTGRNALDHALSDGEDYELLFTLSGRADTETFERAWRKTFRTPVTRIGSFIAGNTRLHGMIDLRRFRGYEHLR